MRARPSATIDTALLDVSGSCLDEETWGGAAYQPTPTIIEAAQALYAQHSVEAIARYDAGAQNLRVTSRRIEEIVDEARAHRRKVICFVTGVPGAGKTLVGLNVATQRATGYAAHSRCISFGQWSPRGGAARSTNP